MRSDTRSKQLRDAALRGDAEVARRLVLEGTSVWISDPDPVTAAELARRAGHEETAAAIDEAMMEAGRRREAREREALRARCESPEAFAEPPRGGAPGSFAITRGSYSPYPQTAARLFFWHIGPSGRLKRLRVGWIAAEDRAAVARALPEALWGDCDAMYAGSPHWIWVRDGRSLRIWHKRTPYARADEERVDVREGRRWRSLRVTQLDAVRVWLSADWTQSGVAVSGGGKTSSVARKRSFDAVVDPTYDQLKLWADAAWTVTLAQALGDVTALPVEVPDDL